MLRTSLIAFVVMSIHAGLAQAGETIVFDNLPPPGTPLSAEGFGVQQFEEEGQITETELAIRFVAPTGAPVQLDLITLGLFRGPEEDGAVRVTVTGDSSQGPSASAFDVVDVIDVPSSAVPILSDDTPPLVLHSDARPTLDPGRAYWVVVTPAAPASTPRRVTWGLGGTVEVSTALRQFDPSQPRPGWIVFDFDLLVRIEATTPNGTPEVAPDAYTVDEDHLLAVDLPGVLANDDDPDGDAITALVERGPDHGTLALAEDGSFTYRPAPDFNGPDGFSYRATDGDLTSAPVEVAITVRSIEDAPVNTVPGPQTVPFLLGLLGNAQFDLAVHDVDTPIVRVTLVARNGRVSLSRTTGLAFTTGDGTSDTSMTFSGSQASINAALTGVQFAPNALAFLLGGGGSLQIISTDPPSGPSDSDFVNISHG